jgi:hypothetical protein
MTKQRIQRTGDGRRISIFHPDADNEPLIQALVEIAKEMPGRMPDADVLRTDHPLQGQTFGGIENALENIAEALNNVAEAIRGKQN